MKDVFPDCFYWIDGTVIRVWRPGEVLTQRVLFNADHGFCSYKFFLVVSPNGRICYVSNQIRGGSENDRTHWNNSSGPEKLAEIYYDIQEYKKENPKARFILGGDKVYRGIRRPPGWENFVTKTAEVLEKEEKKEGEEERRREEEKEREEEGDGDGKESGGGDGGDVDAQQEERGGREEREVEKEGEKKGEEKEGRESYGRVMGCREWWGEYEKNKSFAKYHAVVERSICAVKR